MSLSQLRYFLEIARTGSIREASEKLNIAASALSRQIQNIEFEIGMRLFERKPRGMALTQAGEVYVRYARATLHEAERVRLEIDELRGLKRGVVRIFSVEGAIADVVIEAVAAFRSRHPGIDFKLNACGTDEVVTAVKDGHADIGVSFNAQPAPYVHFVRRIHDPVVAIVHPDHPLASRRRVSLPDLLDHPLAIPNVGFGIRRLVDDAARRDGVSLIPALETNSIEALRGFARSGTGVTMLPRTSCRREIKGRLVRTIPFANSILESATMDLSVLAERSLPTAAAAFLPALEECLAAQG